MDQTQTRFLALWTRCGGIEAEAVYDNLKRHYAEPARHYHTLRHIHRCVRELDWARAAIPDPDTVELALWCHDVIYVPGAKDNELRSAEWLRRWAGDRIDVAARSAACIEATTHTVTPAELDACFTLDIDLADLGSDRARFRRAEACLRAERPDLDDMTYDAGERSFLGELLRRPRIYHTDLFHARCEARARAHLAWRLSWPVPR